MASRLLRRAAPLIVILSFGALPLHIAARTGAPSCQSSTNRARL